MHCTLNSLLLLHSYSTPTTLLLHSYFTPTPLLLPSYFIPTLLLPSYSPATSLLLNSCFPPTPLLYFPLTPLLLPPTLPPYSLLLPSYSSPTCLLIPYSPPTPSYSPSTSLLLPSYSPPNSLLPSYFPLTYLASSYFISLYFTSFQVKHGREDLITHPLVVYLLDSKWRMFGRTLFYLKLSLFLFFLTFLTGYVIMATRNSPKPKTIVPNTTANETNTMKCISTKEDTLAFEVFVEVGRYILLIAACAHLLLEVSLLALKDEYHDNASRAHINHIGGHFMGHK